MAKEKAKPVTSAGLPEIPDRIQLAPIYKRIDWKRIFFILLGVGLFFLFYLMPPLPDAVDPTGKHFALSPQGKAALGLFLMAGIWWVFEVVPIGVTSIAIGVVQAIFLIRSAKDAFRDFMDPSVMFIFGSLLIGLAFTKSGLTRRLAYRMLAIVGENTKTILLGTMVLVAALAHFMAHTAAAATVFPILMAIYSLYGEGERPTKFGKALFIGMAYSAGAGSIATMLGSARAPAGVGMFKEFTGQDITFFELSKYLIPISWLMIILIWLLLIVFFKPEKSRIEGLKKKAQDLYKQLGPMTGKEKFVILLVIGVVITMTLQSFLPAMRYLDRSAIILVAGLLFFLSNLITVKELEEIPWNIVLLFSGAMSIGFCLWQVGTAQWLAVHWLNMFKESHWLVFVMSIAAFVLIMTNFIMNVAAIAISLPVALVIAKYLGVSPEVVFFASLVTAGMPFVLLIGAAPNAMSYESKQFTTGEFFGAGIPASIVLLVILTIAILTIWPILGMPILVK
jgi:solute carrier family 13 (sodium-dependent dicarboxylate transporter), member 2/3/5